LGKVYLELKKLAEKANKNPVFREKAKGWNKVIHFRIVDDLEESCVVATMNGEVSIQEAGVPNPDITVTTDMESFDEIVKGSLKPSSAFLRGRLKAEGPIFDLIKLNSVFKILLGE
jgi:putative sterol carrier protein